MNREKDEYRRRLRGEDTERRATSLSAVTRGNPGPVSIHPLIRSDIERASTLFGYLAIPPEPDVSPLMEVALSAGATVLAPRVLGGNLAFAPIPSVSGPFAVGPFGIREPLPDVAAAWPGEPPEGRVLILVPGLAFSRGGARLGRGKGYYDRFLASLLSAMGTRRDDVRIVGICAPDRVREDVPTEPHDVPVDCLWTEKDGIFALY